MKYALIYGVLSGAVAICVLVFSLTLNLPNHTHSLWFGYLVMLASLSLIFVAVKRYRDVECGGAVRFGRALAVGLGIALVAGVIYALGWELYLAMSGKDFMADYSASILNSMRAKGMPAAAIQAKAAELRAMAVQYRNPLFRLPMTFIEIFPVGFIVALVSAALLRNPKLFPATSR